MLKTIEHSSNPLGTHAGRCFLRLLAVLVVAVMVAGCGASHSKTGSYGGAPAPVEPAVYANRSGGEAMEPPMAPQAVDSTGDYDEKDYDDAEESGDADYGDDRVAQAGAPAAKPGAAQPAPAPAPAPQKLPAPSTGKPAVVGAQPLKKLRPMLIYKANVTMAVFEVTKKIEEVHQSALDAGGYLVRRSRNEIEVRVPAGGYRTYLETLLKLGDVLQHDESVEDVTNKVLDMQVRLKNALALRDRLELLLKRANKVEEALKIEQELARIRTTIESMKGQLKRMKELVSFSTITVSFRPRASETPNQSKVNLPFSWLRELGLRSLLSL